MTRHESLQHPDRFQLEAAARHHRSEVWAEVFGSFGHWLGTHRLVPAWREEPRLALSPVQRRLVH